MVDRLKNRDWQILSEYLDNQLKTKDRKRLEDRLQANPDLNQALHELRMTRAILRSQPKIQAPRSFALKPDTVQQFNSNYQTHGYPAQYIVSLVSVVAIFLLAFFLVGDFTTSSPLVRRQTGEFLSTEMVEEPMLLMEEAPMEEPVAEMQALEAADSTFSMAEEAVEETSGQPSEGPMMSKAMPEEPCGGGAREGFPSATDQDGVAPDQSFYEEVAPSPPQEDVSTMENSLALIDHVPGTTFLNIPRSTLTILEITLAILAGIAITTFLLIRYKAGDKPS